MSSPAFFGEGSLPRVKDTIWRINQKILGALVDGSGGGGGGGSSSGGVQILALGGTQPPTDGSVTKFTVKDSDTGWFYFNSGTLAAPVWNLH